MAIKKQKEKVNNKNKKNNTKVIFVTGGVISGIGKGITAASIGNILKARGYKIFMQKLDCYLNIDPGVLSPYEHGEVYVTEDGGETDLDLGHYERFIDETLTKESNYTTGKIYQRIFENERKGKYDGKTVQMVPHFTNEIINVIDSTISKNKPDFLIVEIGGTIGDIESSPFIKAISEYGFKNPQSSYFVHVTYVPWINASKEFKTKPTQNSISLLSSSGINPNMILLRSQNQINDDIIDKISNLSYIKRDCVISLYDFDSVYKIPLYLESQGVCTRILEHFSIKPKKSNLTEWEEFVNKLENNEKKNINIAMVGKYIELEDAYKSIKEALFISGVYENANIKFDWISSDGIDEKNVSLKLRDADGVVVLPGFGKRGFEGKVATVNYTRKNKIPTLGICFGMQAMTINQARLKGIKDATSSEISDKGTFILDIIEGKDRENIGGTLRLGSDGVILKENSLIKKIYGQSKIFERSRHRYEVNPKYVPKIEDKEFKFSGFNEENKLIEVCELDNHPFYVGVQYHPEFNAKPLRPSKLFTAFIKSVLLKVN
ncbi:MAG: CTP synthase [Mycoplasma sp.]|nr:CTP synthase [Mycoplasma sp.]